MLIATYVFPGIERTTALIKTVTLLGDGERLVHGTPRSPDNTYCAPPNEARAQGHGVVLLHSHPSGKGWQRLSATDWDTESEYECVAYAITKMPLLGGGGRWRARM
ncbi:hypothetical protein GCM10020255_004450 [Rhodococcus baikonurensis]